MEDRIVPFIYGGYVSPIDDAQLKIILTFFDTVAKAIELGSEKLRLQKSKIVDGKFCLKLESGGYYQINPVTEAPTVIRVNENLDPIAGNFGILESQIIQITEELLSRMR